MSTPVVLNGTLLVTRLAGGIPFGTVNGFALFIRQMLHRLITFFAFCRSFGFPGTQSWFCIQIRDQPSRVFHTIVTAKKDNSVRRLDFCNHSRDLNYLVWCYTVLCPIRRRTYSENDLSR
ncbi:hypothetical protein DERF_009755 [Dermatophagoides farinae]|uniref:Uncharacterized protein n=1 Tax=Dermatophagoides farinae TaxID=6954 RepID=A0A922HYM3_DERFA|nr:hypothetical protein DERF_009755 [Dermatophagoides farinae]